MKNLIYLFVFITITLGVSSCCEYFSNCTVEDKCTTNSDCTEKEYCDSNKTCQENNCLTNDHYCGKGKCMPGPYPGTTTSSFHCECEENAVITAHGKLCIPTCNGYSEECTEFGLRCNMEKGHCDTICQGVGSCPDGYTCVNSCEKIID